MWTMQCAAVFQLLMQKSCKTVTLTEDQILCSLTIDDVLIFSDTLDDHLEHLELVISRRRSRGMKLNPSKCQFAAMGTYIQWLMPVV